MPDLRSKLLATIGPAIGVATVTGAAILLAVPSALALVRAVGLNPSSPEQLQLAATLLNTGLLTGGTLFTIARWFAISDKLGELTQSNKAVGEVTSSLLGRVAANEANDSETLEALVRIEQNQGARLVFDSPQIWENLTHRMDSYNGTFLRELRPGPTAGTYVVDPERLAIFVDRLTNPKLQMTYVLFVPRSVGFGVHPVSTVQRLIYLIRAACEAASAKGLTITGLPRLFLIDAPRPSSSFFLTSKAVAGKGARRIALEYFRSIEPGVVDSPTAERQLLEHTNPVDIDRLEVRYDEKVKSSVEIDFEACERALRPIVGASDQPVQAHTRKTLKAVIDAMYASVYAKEFETVDQPGHFSVRELKPSRLREPSPPPKTLEVSTDPSNLPAVVAQPLESLGLVDRAVASARKIRGALARWVSA